MGYYDRYRGSRRKRRNRVKLIFLLLALLIVIACAALFFLQDKVIFTADGFRFPFGEEKQPEKPAPDEELNDPDADEVPFEVVEPDGTVIEVPEDGEPIDPVLSALQEPFSALSADGLQLVQDMTGLLQKLNERGCAQLALHVKSPDGVALVDDGLLKDAVAPEAGAFAQALQDVTVPKIAVISALRDNLRPRALYRSSALHTESGATWLDRDYMAWFDPEGEDTLTALSSMVAACEQAGFEQVVLENFQYPTMGRLELIDYSQQRTRQSALIELAKNLRECTDLPLGLVLTDAAAAQLLDQASGQDVPDLAHYFDILYVPAEDFTADTFAVEQACEGTGCQVGLYIRQPAAVPEGFSRSFILAS